MDYIKQVDEMIENKRDLFIDVSNNIWDYAETSFEENRSAELLCKRLEEQGFKVKKGISGMDTAFVGSYGSGKPVVAILGEYDALAGLSQQKGVSVKSPIVQGANGHGCGHNLLGTGSFAAAVAVKEYMEKHHLPGTVRYYGCPAEESGDGKTFMVRDGVFADVDFALTWHPAPVNGIAVMNALATYQVYFKFKGRAAHAAAAPHLGRSALDAVELMNVGVNYLREHIIQDARIHYAVTNTGGFSPNVVQSEAEVLYLIRAPKVPQVDEIFQRVRKIAEGAALMTETEVDFVFDSGTSNIIQNATLDRIMEENFKRLGCAEFSEEEKKFARDIRETLSEAEKNDVRGKGLADKELTEVFISQEFQKQMTGSTDVADVSWVTPTAQCLTTCVANGTSLHTWQAVAQVGSSIGHKGMWQAGKVMAATTVEILQDGQLLINVKEDFKATLEDETYMCPIPDEVKPGVGK
ncbi:M20 family metallopeptidase [Salipaludibacillus sp. CF4.18]|uniref:M20 family metallopeptidase n=1 Tax=Salipaludibacillus sp. CF4.18 TaxID=3373081 RepID=UPI003EE7666A